MSGGSVGILRGRLQHVQTRVADPKLKAMFGEALPARTLISVPNLAINLMLFEVEAVVVLD